MIVRSKIKLDMAQQGAQSRVSAVQGDGNTRAVEAELLANGSSWKPDAGWEAAITYRKPDGTKGLYNLLDDGSSAITISGSTATVILAAQMLTVPGTVRAAIVFNNQRLDQLTSFPFTVSVARNQFAGAQQSEDYIRLQWLENKLEERIAQLISTEEAVRAGVAAQEANAAAESALEAAQAANEAVSAANTAADAAQAVVDGIVPELEHLRSDLAEITPDDAAIDGKPWTSKKIVDSLCQPFEETGNPVQCYPVANYEVGVKIQIAPKQEGDGYPSPENVRPIAGMDAVQIVHSNDAGASSSYDISLPETVYGGTLDMQTGVLTVDKKLRTLTGNEAYGAYTYTNGFYTGLFDGISIAYNYNTTKFICSHFRRTAFFDENYFGGCEDAFCQEAGGTHKIAFRKSGIEKGDVSAFREWVKSQYDSGTPVQVCYILKDPITLQLTPQRITALSGVNTICTDAEGVIVTSREDPQHTITQLKNAILSLGGNV